MKLVTFEIASVLGPFRRVGVLDGEQILDVAAACSARLGSEMTAEAASEVAAATIGRTMIDFFARGTSARDAAERALEFARESEDGELEGSGGERVWHKFSEVSLKAPVPRPNTLRDCTGFMRHMETFAKASNTQVAGGELLTKRPLYYKANPEMVIGPGDEIKWPSISEKLDVEIEPALYIGKPGRNIAEDEAGEHIAGFTIFNDVSLRDVQIEEIGLPVNPWGLSKSKDAGGYPMGPCVVTPDEVDPRNLELIVRVNGEEWIRGNTQGMTWSFEQMIACASLEEPLHVGDCIAGGSPPNGTGSEIGRWVQPGDIVECEIVGIGILRNAIGSPEMAGSRKGGRHERTRV